MNKSRRDFIETAAKVSLAGSMLSTVGFSPAIQQFGKSRISASDQIRIGVIGTGGRGTGLIRLLHDIEGMSVVACCDILPFRLDDALAHAAPEAKGYADYRKILDDASIDAVIISTPLYLHYQMAKDAVEAGKHIYCEKTMTFTIDEAQKLGKLLDGSPNLFQVGYQHRYNPLYAKVKELINGEDFGHLGHIECYWNRNGDWRRPVPDPKFERIINWRMYREYSGGMMAELSSHQMNIINWMVGRSPSQVMGTGGIDYWKDGRETFDNIHAMFSYENGLKVNCTCLTTNAQMGFQMRFYGKNATIQIAQEEQEYVARLYIEPRYLADVRSAAGVDAVSGASEKWSKGEPIQLFKDALGKEDAEPTGHALRSFGECIRENRKPAVGYE
ncbi:MAG: Gfo/Idh/MocA family oxidoreductase, partial [Saprospiraceae bacterium]|nr:Gfo/Idh/MocA family oxidoreductase [Saprospiraceae bacterium]